MPTGHRVNPAEWNQELRIGMHRSIAHFRRQLNGPLNEFDREGMKDLLNLLEEYMTVTWPNNAA
jgi:hypothetical protein